MRSNTRAALFAAFLTLPALGGCVSATQMDDMNLRLSSAEQQVRTLSNQMNALQPADTRTDLQTMQRDISVLRNRVDDLTSRVNPDEIARLSAEVKRLESAVRLAHAQLGIDLAPLDAPLAVPAPPAAQAYAPASEAPSTAQTPVSGAPVAIPPASGLVPGETVTVIVNGVPRQMKVEGPSLTATPAAQPGNVTTPSAGGAQTAVSSTAEATAGKVAGMQPTGTANPENQLYDAASKSFAARNYKEALAQWKQFTDLYPNHSLTSNAYFWQGEASYQMQDYPRAAVAYQQVIEKFPRSSKYPAALLKQGMSFARSGKKEAGRVRLEELIKKFPKSTEAARAKKVLADLK